MLCCSPFYVSSMRKVIAEKGLKRTKTEAGFGFNLCVSAKEVNVTFM